MSVTELAGQGSRGYDADYERTPPQDVAAEQSVIGGMLLSKDAIADVVEVLRGPDFYKPAHELVFETVIDLYGRGEPADAVTVAAELTKRGELGRVGGAPYLHTLINMVPTAANAGYYAQIVRERAVLRRLVEAGTRIVQLGYGAEGGDADDIVDRAQAEIYGVTDRRTSEDYLPLSEVMEGTLDEIEAIGSRGGQLVGVPTGFADLDQLTNGLHPGQMVVVAARPAMGKALALDTPLPTPTGWTTMGQVAVGDRLLGADGRPTTVVAATEVLHGRPCFRVAFSDGTTIVADAEHQWLTETPFDGALPAVRTTAEIAATLGAAAGAAGRRPAYSVACARPLDLPARDLPLSPYVLGAWLGAGLSGRASVGAVAPDVVVQLESEGVEVIRQVPSHLELRLAAPAGAGECRGDALQAGTEGLGVLGDGQVPQPYLRTAEAPRRELLAGLLDTAGTVTEAGCVELAVSSRRLADDVRELLLGLGYPCPVPRRAAGSPPGYVVSLRTSDEVFRSEPKKLLHKDRAANVGRRPGDRVIRSVRPVPSVAVRCVEVDSADHLYLAGRSMVPTHNSTLGLDIARSASIKHGLASVVFSLEMSRNEITMRLLSAEARVALHHMRSGTMNEDDWNRLARRMGEVSAAPLFIDDSPNMSMMEIRAKCRRLKQRHGLRLVVIDYLQLMTSGKRVESRQQEVSEFSRALKLLAKELEVPVIAISQLNRGAEQRTDKKPQMADLRESGSIEQDADMVILLHREEMYERESPRAGEADFIVAKHRNGPTATITVAFQGHYSRFVDMAQM